MITVKYTFTLDDGSTVEKTKEFVEKWFDWIHNL